MPVFLGKCNATEISSTKFQWGHIVKHWRIDVNEFFLKAVLCVYILLRFKHFWYSDVIEIFPAKSVFDVDKNIFGNDSKNDSVTFEMFLKHIQQGCLDD